MSTTQIPLLAVTPKQHCFPISIYMTTSQRDDFIPDDSETTSCFLSPAYTCGIKYAQRPCRCLCPCDNKTSLFSLTCTLLTTMQVFFSRDDTKITLFPLTYFYQRTQVHIHDDPSGVFARYDTKMALLPLTCIQVTTAQVLFLVGDNTKTTLFPLTCRYLTTL